MRFMVEQKQTVLSRKTISLPSGAKRFARRRTRFSSVPMAHFEPAGAASRALMMYSVEPT